MMTLDEAIKHCNDVASSSQCNECGEEHKQLAEWLKELKCLREVVDKKYLEGINMATIKAYTDLEQSKKLAEILPLESADMYYALSEDKSMNVIYFGKPQGFFDKTQVAWSLAALFDVLPEYNLQRTDWENKTEYKIVVTAVNDYNYASKNYDNPLDACVAIIEKLNELNLL